eukprot:COSAG06_NODE_5274_length_3593_cov_25.942187_4_plen_120_part_00
MLAPARQCRVFVLFRFVFVLFCFCFVFVIVLFRFVSFFVFVLFRVLFFSLTASPGSMGLSKARAMRTIEPVVAVIDSALTSCISTGYSNETKRNEAKRASAVSRHKGFVLLSRACLGEW